MNVLNKKSVEDIDVRGKKVLIRCDFNVKMENGEKVINPIAQEVVKITDGNKMFIFGLVMGILSIIFYLVGYKTTKERVPSEADPKVDLKKTYLGLLKSRPFVTVALAGVLISGQLQFNSFNTYLYKNYFTNTSLGILGTVCNYLPMVCLVLFTPKLSAKYGKKELADAEKKLADGKQELADGEKELADAKMIYTAKDLKEEA